MKRLVAVLVLVVVSLGSGASAQEATPSANQLSVHGTITATGRYVFTWLDTDLCVISFMDYDATPTLAVVDKSGKQLASLDLASLPGKVTMAGPVGNQHAEVCTVPYEVPVPASATYQVVLDPYYKSAVLTSADISQTGGLVDVKFERQEGDVGPDFRQRPSGPIVGTHTYRIAGTLELFGSSTGSDRTFFPTPFGCIGLGGYDDIMVGARVTVSNQDRTIIGAGALEPIYLPDEDRCVFTFTIDVPDATFYSIELGRRGELTYSREEMDKAGWHIDLTLGQ
jgi:hypothetical protein